MSLRVEAAYFDGRTARRQPATLTLAGADWCLSGDFGERRGAVAELRVSEPLGRAPRTLHWPDGAYCEVHDAAGFAALLAAAGQRPSAVVVLQGRMRWAVAALVALLALVWLGYVQALPWAAEAVAARLPDRVVGRLSAEVLATLDGHLLHPSALPAVRQQAIAQAMARLASAAAPLPPYRLHFRRAPDLPPNAFALPGGDIVVFDSLVALADSDAEVVAVLAHELGHVAHRHGVRQMLQSTVVSAVTGLYLGDVSSLVAGFGALVLESRYSREFEREADRYGARLLGAAGMLAKLDTPRAGANEGGAVPALLATHLDTAARIAALRGAAR